MKFSVCSKQKFTLGINPAELSTAQEKGVRIIKTRGHTIPMFYKKAGMVKTERLLKAHLTGKRKGTIKKDGNTAVELRLIYMFPHTSSAPKWMREQVTFMTERPDADNISKSVVDCMTELGFWEDDSMVFAHPAKYRAPHPCIKVEIIVWKQERNPEEEKLFCNS